MLKNSCGIIIFKKKNLTLQVNGTHFKFDLKNATHQPWVFFFLILTWYTPMVLKV
jgi:hypothetical protein